jgi:DNA-binding transcriptional LysR family regulator
MTTPAALDWNLLPALHALLDEASVTRAAERVGVTVPSMSRMLARLREVFGDELLVRAGRELVPTPRAIELRDRVAALAAGASELLAESALPALATTARTLVIRGNDVIAAPAIDRLVAAVRARAPHVVLAFVAEGDERPDELRDGRVDLDIGVADDSAPELRTQKLVEDRFVAVVRRGHPLLRARRRLARLAEYPHVAISRRGRARGPIDAALRARGLSRTVVATVPSIAAAALVVARTDWVTAIPRFIARALAGSLPVAWFELPFPLPPLAIAQTWHPRFDRDPAHRLLRESMRALVGGAARQR